MASRGITAAVAATLLGTACGNGETPPEDGQRAADAAAGAQAAASARMAVATDPADAVRAASRTLVFDRPIRGFDADRVTRLQRSIPPARTDDAVTQRWRESRVERVRDEARATADYDPNPRVALILNGEPETGYLGVAMLMRDTGAEGWAACTATLVACDLLLTAAHCVGSTPATRDADDYRAYFPGIGLRAVAHGSIVAYCDGRQDCEPKLHDLAALRLATPSGVMPHALSTAADWSNGSAGVMVGYGDANGDLYGPGFKRSGTIKAIAADTVGYLKVAGIESDATPTGLCPGDSGGPLLDPDDDGVVGVAKKGSQSCFSSKGDWLDMRHAPYHDWISSRIDASECAGVAQANPAVTAQINVLEAGQQVPLSIPGDAVAPIRVTLNYDRFIDAAFALTAADTTTIDCDEAGGVYDCHVDSLPDDNQLQLTRLSQPAAGLAFVQLYMGPGG